MGSIEQPLQNENYIFLGHAAHAQECPPQPTQAQIQESQDAMNYMIGLLPTQPLQDPPYPANYQAAVQTVVDQANSQFPDVAALYYPNENDIGMVWSYIVGPAVTLRVSNIIPPGDTWRGTMRVLCSPATPTPVPPAPRFIYNVTLNRATRGTTIFIQGSNMTPNVSFIDSNGTITTFTGRMDSWATGVNLIVPNTLSPGQYSITVGPNPDSNQLPFEILPDSPNSTVSPPGGSSSSPQPCDQSQLNLGITLICDFEPSVAAPGATIEMSGANLGPNVNLYSESGSLTPLTGSLSNNNELVTFNLPSNIQTGNYSIEDVSITGSAKSSKNLSIITTLPKDVPTEGGPMSASSPTASSNPPATRFEELIGSVFSYAIDIVGIAVFIMILFAGFLWLTSAANPGNISRAKSMIFNAILGAILLLSAYVILYTVNPGLVGGVLNLPGITSPNNAASAGARVIAYDEAGAASAISAGCSVVIDRPDFTSLDCPGDIASALSLPADPVFQAQDEQANQQTGITPIINGGNQGQGRTVVVLDSGIDYNHPELSANYIGGYDFVNHDNDPLDDYHHGTRVAGIIGARGNDPRARGVAPQVRLLAGKVLDNQGFGNWSNIVQGIYWAVDGPDGRHGTADDPNPDAINISIGGGNYSNLCDNISKESQDLAKAIQYARDNGSLVVVAAGNNAPVGVALPGCIDKAFTVGAVDSSNTVANFSDRGAGVDVSAPGVSLYMPNLGGGYTNDSGTSFAAPMVSGLVALIKNAHPNYTPDQTEQVIESTAVDLGVAGKDPFYGWGRVSGNAVNGNPTSSQKGTLSLTPVSCTKGVLPANPNCNTAITYTANNVTGPIVLIKDSNPLQTINCNSTCNGTVADNNPNSGTHAYNLTLQNGTVIAQANSYISAQGTIGAGFGSCTKGLIPANTNCNISISINVSGVAPNSAVITKDGANWRLIPCAGNPCTGTATDSNPSVGTHTYTVTDPSNAVGGRLNRVTVSIYGSGGLPQCVVQPGAAMQLCTGTNLTGTCQTFNCAGLSNFTGTQLAGQNIRSARVSGIARAKVYSCDTGWVHPNPSATEPTPCLWKYVYANTPVPDIWAPANDWCYWTWQGSGTTIVCGQATPVAPGIQIKSYGGLYPGSF